MVCLEHEAQDGVHLRDQTGGEETLQTVLSLLVETDQVVLFDLRVFVKVVLSEDHGQEGSLVDVYLELEVD